MKLILKILTAYFINLLFLNYSHSEISLKVHEGNLNEKNTNFFKPSKREEKIATAIVNIINQANQDRIDNSSLQYLFGSNLTDTPFSIFDSWRVELKNIHSIKELKYLYPICERIMEKDYLITPEYNLEMEKNLKELCVSQFLKLFQKEINAQNKIDKNIYAFLSKNNSYLIGNKSFEKFIVKIPPHSEIYYNLSAIFQNSFPLTFLQINGPSEIPKHINQTNIDFNQFFSKKEKDKIYKSYYKKFKDLIKDLKSNAKENIAISKSQQLISFYTTNSDLISKDDPLLDLISLSRTLICQKSYASSDFILKNIFQEKLAAENKNEIIFLMIWSHIIRNNYQEAYKLMEQHQVLENFSKMPSQIQFWTAYTLNEIKKPIQAMKYYRALISNFPLTYYAIMASKKLNSLEFNGEKVVSNRDYLKEKILSNAVSEKFIINHYRPSLIKSLKRLIVWSKLKNNYFINLEIKNFINKDNAQIFTQEALTEGESSKNLREQMIIFIANQLSYYSNHLKSFSILQQSIEKSEVSLNKKLLSLLFPPLYMPIVSAVDKDLDPIIVLSLIRQESGFNPYAKSVAGALGLMQLMPPTAKRIQRSVSKHQLYNPHTNLKIGIFYLKKLLKKYNGNLIYTLAAYNAGEGNLEKWIKNVFSSESTLHVIESIPFQETRNYVKLIFRNIYFYKAITQEPNFIDGPQVTKIFDVSLGTQD